MVKFKKDGFINNPKCDCTITKYNKVVTNKEKQIVESTPCFYIEFERSTQVATGTRSCIGQYGSQWCYEDDYDEASRDIKLTLDEFMELSSDIEDIKYDKEINKFESIIEISNFLDCIHDEYPDVWDEIEEILSGKVEEIIEYERESAEAEAAEAAAEARAEAMLDRYDY